MVSQHKCRFDFWEGDCRFCGYPHSLFSTIAALVCFWSRSLLHGKASVEIVRVQSRGEVEDCHASEQHTFPESANPQNQQVVCLRGRRLYGQHGVGLIVTFLDGIRLDCGKCILGIHCNAHSIRLALLWRQLCQRHWPYLSHLVLHNEQSMVLEPTVAEL